jgi:hypothetical protein
MNFLLKIISILLFIVLFRCNLSAQWEVDVVTDGNPYFINVVDTGTIWSIGYTSGWWDDVRLFTKSPENGWLWIDVNNLPVNVQYTCIAGINSTTAFVGDINGHVYKSTNYGWGWNLILNAGQNYMVTDIKFSRINRNTGYAFCCRSDYVADVFKIYKTTDYGNTWQLFTPYFGNFGFANKPTSWITDSAHAWIGLTCLSSSCPYVPLVYTTNGGVNWLTSNVEPNRHVVEAIAFSYDNMFGIAISHKLYYSKHRLYSTNGGLNWNNIDTINQGNVLSLITVPVTSVWYMNGNAYNIDNPHEPYVYKSSNNGMNWFRMTIPDSTEVFADMDAVKLGDKIYAWATGYGRILKLVDTAVAIGINNNGSIIPDSYELEQNYPNPFNPKSVIRYSVPKSCIVTIKIYDLQGKEIVVLLRNESKTPGRYSVVFDGSNFASGVYIYRLEAGDFASNKKMVLVK